MRTFTINLLPPEFAREQKEKKKFRKVQLISVVAILILIFLSSTTAALRFLQVKSVQDVEAQVQNSEVKVISLKGTEINLAVLKNKLSTIKTISSEPSKQTILFNEINQILPQQIQIISMAVNDSDKISMNGIVSDPSILDQFFQSALDSKQQSDFTKIELNDLTRGRDGVYRFTLQLVIK